MEMGIELWCGTEGSRLLDETGKGKGGEGGHRWLEAAGQRKARRSGGEDRGGERHDGIKADEEERSGSQGIRLGRSRSFSRHALGHASRGGAGGRKHAIPRRITSVFLF
jgi:hypothetical protein